MSEAPMSVYLVAALVVLAVLLFWVIGAYNRLVAMRNDIFQAWTKVQAALGQRAAAVEPLVNALREPMAAEQGALDTWLAAHTDAAKAASALLSARAVDEKAALDWVAAESTLAAAASRVLALLEQATELRQQDPVVTWASRWREAQARLPFARQLFNETAQAYNDAVAIFPTRWVARGFKLRRAGLI